MKKTMRDAFWDKIYDLAKSDRDIVIVSADLAAPALDKFRRDMPGQFINVGIAEQNAILVAAGLALTGKKPIAYAISQFITLRCFEQIRLYPAGMNLPVTIVGNGAGACYWESGPTHCCMEQLSIMRTLPNLQIINVSDALMAETAAEYAAADSRPKYIQLDRDAVESVSAEIPDFAKGFRLAEGGGEIAIIATGIMVKECLDLLGGLAGDERRNFSLIDFFSLTGSKNALLDYLKTKRRILTVEENSLPGGMGSLILELLNEAGLVVPVKRIGMSLANGYAPSYRYGSRQAVRSGYGVGRGQLLEAIKDCI